MLDKLSAPQPLVMLLSIAACTLSVSTAADRCDLSGNWVFHHSSDGTNGYNDTVSTIISIQQDTASGDFGILYKNSTPDNHSATPWTVGTLDTNRHVQLQAPGLGFIIQPNTRGGCIASLPCQSAGEAHDNKACTNVSNVSDAEALCTGTYGCKSFSYDAAAKQVWLCSTAQDSTSDWPGWVVGEADSNLCVLCVEYSLVASFFAMPPPHAIGASMLRRAAAQRCNQNARGYICTAVLFHHSNPNNSVMTTTYSILC